MTRQYPPYSALFLYPDGSTRYRLAKFPSQLEGIFKRSKAIQIDIFKNDRLYQFSRKCGDIITVHLTNQYSLFG